MPQFVLVHSPLVGPSTLEPTAEVLRTKGFAVHVPTPISRKEQTSWHNWPRCLLNALPIMRDPIMVGHSAGGLLAAHLAGTLKAKAFICLDAMMPPEQGKTSPVEPDFMHFIRSLPTENGLLPVWTDWWEDDLLANTAMSTKLRATILSELPRLHVDWFDDSFDMPNWSRSTRGYIQTSPVFNDEAKRANEHGWPVITLQGTHLHPALSPKETARAIMDMCQNMAVI